MMNRELEAAGNWFVTFRKPRQATKITNQRVYWEEESAYSGKMRQRYEKRYDVVAWGETEEEARNAAEAHTDARHAVRERKREAEKNIEARLLDTFAKIFEQEQEQFGADVRLALQKISAETGIDVTGYSRGRLSNVSVRLSDYDIRKEQG